MHDDNLQGFPALREQNLEREVNAISQLVNLFSVIKKFYICDKVF